MNINKRKIRNTMKRLKGLCLLVCMLCLLYDGGASRVQASGWKMPEEFSEIKGDGKYIQQEYVYYLDMEKVGLIDSFLSAFNGIANILFSLEVLLARAAVYLFYYCMTFNTSMFSEQINTIQALLKESLFLPFFQVALVLLGVKLVTRLFRRNFIGIFSECAYTVIIFVTATFVVLYSGTILDVATDTAKQISIQSMVSMNTATDVQGATTEEYAAIASGLLWKNIVHDPWRQLEFGDAENTEALEETLMHEGDSDKRQEIVSGKSESIPTLKGLNVFARCGMVLFYFVPIVVKGGIYSVLAVAQLFFQIMAAFFVLLAPLILVVSLFPGYGTMIIETWLRKLMEFEIGIIIMTLLIAFMVYLDNVMLGMSEQYGTIMSFLLQIAIALSLFFGRSHIFSMFQKMQKAIQSPGYGNSLLRNAATTNPGQIKRAKEMAVEAVTKAPARVKVAGGAVIRTGHGISEKIKNLDTMVQVVTNGNTAKGLDVKTQERAYDLYQSTKKRKQEKEKKKELSRERKQKAENKKTAHRVKAVNFWSEAEDAKLVDLNAKRPKTRAAREAEKRDQAAASENVVVFRNSTKASETQKSGSSAEHMHGKMSSAAAEGEQTYHETAVQKDKSGKVHDSQATLGAVKHSFRTSDSTTEIRPYAGRRTEQKISSVSLPSPGVQIRERTGQNNRKTRPAAWKQMKINRLKGEADDRSGAGTGFIKNIPTGTAGKRSSAAGGRKTAAGQTADDR